MTQTEHAKNLYDLALSVVRERGRQIGTGSMMVIVYQHGLLTIRNWPKARDPRRPALAKSPEDRAVARDIPGHPLHAGKLGR